MLKKIVLILIFPINAFAFGSLSKSVTQGNIDKTVCVPGYSASIRPDVTITNKIKLKMIDNKKIPRSEISKYQLDHIVPLSVGGAPLDINNFQLQPYFGEINNAKAKDAVEHKIHSDLCKGKISLVNAQNIFLENRWKFYQIFKK